MHFSPRLRRAAAAALTVGALALATACGTSANPQNQETATVAPDANAAVNPDATLNVGLVLAPANLDAKFTGGAALDQVLIDNIYEGLVSRTPTNEIVPRLAKEYTVSEDGLTYTFTLNDGVTFHSGAAMTSADVVASLEEARTDETRRDHAAVAKISSITAPDEKTVVITLPAVDQDFLFNLTGRAGLVFQSGDTTDLKTAANGTGPFVVDQWVENASLTFKRNDAYWGEKAGVAEVVFQYIPESASAVGAAVSGDLDVVTAVDPQLASQLESAQFNLTTGQTTDTATLAFNNKKAPLDDIRVREALRLSIDHVAMANALGNAETLYGPIPALDPGYEDLSDVAPYDVEKAKQLLADAGQENLKLTLTFPNFYPTKIAQLLVSDFKKAGVELTVDQVDFNVWYEKAYTNKDYELSFVWHAEPRDLYNYTNPEYYFNYDNPEVQAKYAEAIAEPDVEKSNALRAEVARMVSEDHAADWVYNGLTITATTPEVTGFPQDSTSSRLDVSKVTKAE